MRAGDETKGARHDETVCLVLVVQWTANKESGWSSQQRVSGIKSTNGGTVMLSGRMIESEDQEWGN